MYHDRFNFELSGDENHTDMTDQSNDPLIMDDDDCQIFVWFIICHLKNIMVYDHLFKYVLPALS